WELLVGAVLAWTTTTGSAESWLTRHGIRTASSWIGLGLMLAALALFNRHTPFPGWAALMPTIGAGLVIAGGPDAWVNRVFLANRGFVFVGLISYPLYLWHWPLLTFARLTDFGGTSSPITAGVLLLSAALAWATYRFLENPIRVGVFKQK